MKALPRTFFSPGRRLLLIGLAALIFSLAAQRYVERRRVEASLVWTDPENKQTLEAGFMALGGFRGILADVLWVRAIAQQDAGHYYELKLICDMIQQLQPTFTNIHSFQARNMTYNLAFKAETCEDKWYWIRSGIEVLERGLERNKHNYALWFDLGFTYMDRLGDSKMIDTISGQDCTPLLLSELPRFDRLTEAQRPIVFTHPETWKTLTPERRQRFSNEIAAIQARGGTRSLTDDEISSALNRPEYRHENLRYAAYYFFKSLETNTNPSPLVVERVYGDCLRGLGLYRSKSIPPDQLQWDDWGAEEWWLELMKRNAERGVPNEATVPHNLQTTMLEEIGVGDAKISAATAAHRTAEVELLKQELKDDYARFQRYFPKDPTPLSKLISIYREARRVRK